MARNRVVYGIYANEMDFSEGVDHLRLAGFRNTDVSVLLSENSGNKDFAHEKNTKAPEGAAAGAGSGAVVGGALGWLVGIGLLSVPGLGIFVAAGPILAMMSGAGVGGVLGGLTGGLIGFGMPEYEAKRYEGRIRKGGALISVHCDNADCEKRAKLILKNSGAEDISASEEAKADFGSSDEALPRGKSLVSSERH